MDAVEFLKTKNRICKDRGRYPNDCWTCPIGNGSGSCQAGVFENQRLTEEELVQIVEKWSAEHPAKTRQSEFLKMFPNAKLVNGHINICPKEINDTPTDHVNCRNLLCSDCKEKYWSEEVKDEKSKSRSK